MIRIDMKMPRSCDKCPLFINKLLGHPAFCAMGAEYTPDEIRNEEDGNLQLYYHGCLPKRPKACPLKEEETVTEFADRCKECGAKYGKLLKQNDIQETPIKAHDCVDYKEAHKDENNADRDIAMAFQFGMAMGFGTEHGEMDKVMKEVKKAIDQNERLHDAFDKIVAEIEREHKLLSASRVDETLELGECLGLKMALKIINKYREEQPCHA